MFSFHKDSKQESPKGQPNGHPKGQPKGQPKGLLSKKTGKVSTGPSITGDKGARRWSCANATRFLPAVVDTTEEVPQKVPQEKPLHTGKPNHRKGKKNGRIACLFE